MPPSTMTHYEVIMRAHQLAPLLREQAMNAETLRRLPADVVEALVAFGVARLLLPPSKGGYGFDIQTICDVIITLAQADGSAGWCAACFLSHNALILSFSEAAQQVVWSQGPDALVATSFVANPYHPVEGGYYLDGTWAWASGIDHCQWCILLARAPEGPPDPRLCLVPRAHYTILEQSWDTVALEGTGSKSIHLDHIFVPSERTVRMSDIFANPLSNPSSPSPFFVLLPILAACVVGVASGAYDDWCQQMRTQKTKAQEPVAAFSHVQIAVAHIAGNIQMAKQLLKEAISAPPSNEQTITNQFAYTRIVDLCTTATTEMLRRGGIRVLHKQHPLQRSWRAIHGMSLHTMFNSDRAATAFGKSELGMPLTPGGLLF